MRICYSFASKSRTVRMFQTLDNIRQLSNSDNYFIVLKLDLDDATMNRPEIIKHLKDKYPECIVKWGSSTGKIHAINRSLEDLPPCDIIIVQSDDMLWETKGFDDEIRTSFETHFPNLDGVLHYPDSFAKSRTMTLTIMGINLYHQLGYLYHPDFLSVYADNHLTEMTRKMGKYVFINKKIFEHHHPISGLVPWDAQYRATESKENYRIDRETFLRHQANNFGL